MSQTHTKRLFHYELFFFFLDCGGFVEDYGGAITMMNMVPSNTLRAFDCIWLIRPRNSHVPDTQVSIRVAQFEEMGKRVT